MPASTPSIKPFSTAKTPLHKNLSAYSVTGWFRACSHLLFLSEGEALASCGSVNFSSLPQTCGPHYLLFYTLSSGRGPLQLVGEQKTRAGKP